MVRVLSSCQVSPKGVGKASTYHATAAVHAISWLALEHFGGGLGASKVGDEGDFCHMCHMCKNPATCGVRAPGSGVELDRQAGLAGQRSLLLHFLAPSSDEGLIDGFRMLSVPVS